MKLSRLCETAGFLRVLYFVQLALKIIFIVVPIILMIATVVNFFKVVVSGKADDMKKVVTTSLKRIVIAIVVFLIPSIIEYTFSFLVDMDFSPLSVCFNNATMENIKYYEKLEPVEMIIQTLENNPTENNVERAYKAVEGAISYAKEDTIIGYYTRISEAEIKAKENTLKIECKAKNGIYENGFCTVIELEPNKPPEPENNGGGSYNGDTSYDPVENPGGTIQVNTLGDNFTVINTRVKVLDYVSIIQKRGVFQSSNIKKYTDMCLGFADTHSWGLYTGNTSYTADDGANYTGASNFASYINDSKQDVLSKVYNEISNGRPAILQVNGNSKGTSRHFVTVVGFNSRVTSPSTITEKDLLIIDSYDGRLERMDQNGSRFMTSGKDCHKDYSGYRMHYLKK